MKQTKNKIMCIFLIAALMMSCFSSIIFARGDDFANTIPKPNPPTEPATLNGAIVMIAGALALPFNPMYQCFLSFGAAGKVVSGGKKYFDPVSSWSDVFFCGISMVRAGFVSTWLMNDAGGCTAEAPRKGLSDEDLNESCHSCNADPYRVCTAERCVILGDCVPVETDDKKGYRCEPGKCDETGDVFFSSFNVNAFIDNASVENVKAADDGAYDKDNKDGTIKVDLGEIPFNTRYISINATTDDLASCFFVLDKMGQNISDMEAFDENLWPEYNWQNVNVLLPGGIQRGMNHTIYIKCKNICGVEHEASYDWNQVIFTLEEKPDQLPPTIVYTDPATPGAVPTDWKKVNVTIVLDENGYCKFSSRYSNFTNIWENMTSFGNSYGTGQDPGYTDVNRTSSVKSSWCVQSQKCYDTNQTKCAHCFMELDLSKGSDDLNWSSLDAETQASIVGSGLENVTKAYMYEILCSDGRNVMAQEDTYPYILYGIPGYNISIVKPVNGEATYVREPDIEVNSSPRITECRYKISKALGATRPFWGDMTPIDEGLADYHTGKHNETLNATVAGTNYKIVAACRDMFKLESRDEHTFVVKQDTIAPKVIRAYHDTNIGDYLVTETDEGSECVYGATSNCAFNFTDGNTMATTDNFIHTAYWQTESNYYIKCRDKWGNIPSPNTCTTIISPYEVPVLG